MFVVASLVGGQIASSITTKATSLDEAVIKAKEMWDKNFFSSGIEQQVPEFKRVNMGAIATFVDCWKNLRAIIVTKQGNLENISGKLLTIYQPFKEIQ